ncbi:Decarboxylase NovR [Cytospora mali]|uniref:Decarboxylase NovR n=1 Tax=Cytospora mali TaxID=578113 RepID=A0A194W7R1_CYTMA|nr:Decarboxylase NovR [Valsa mali]
MEGQSPAAGFHHIEASLRSPGPTLTMILWRTMSRWPQMPWPTRTNEAGLDLCFKSYPQFTTLKEERQYRKQHLAAAFRVFAGHNTVRDPTLLKDRFWLNPFERALRPDQVIDADEGARIAEALSGGKAVILQHRGFLTVGSSVDEAAFWFVNMDRACHAQLLADAAAAGSGHEKSLIDEDESENYARSIGGPEKGWLVFQPYYDVVLARTNGWFLE